MNHDSETLHLITDVSTGGAQIVLHQLLKATRSSNACVLSMAVPGSMAPMFEQLGVSIRFLDIEVGRPPAIADILKLRRMTKDINPSLVQGWMYHGNIAAFVAARARRRRIPLIWGVHHTITKLQNEKLMTRAVIRLSAKLSRFTDGIIYCSKQSAHDHELLGFDSEKSIVIPNGIDCSLFRPDPDAGPRLRQELGITDDRKIIGFVARFHPMKDHRNLIKAARQLHDRSCDVQVVFIGTGNESQKNDLRTYIAECGLEDRVTFMGLRQDVQMIMPGFDVFCLPSAWGEAFPLVVCEAMACGVPCVVTDVGDAAWIVGDTGLVAPRQDSNALANALQAMCDLGDDALKQRGATARQRISEEFPLSKMVASYQDFAESIQSKHKNIAA